MASRIIALFLLRFIHVNIRENTGDSKGLKEFLDQVYYNGLGAGFSTLAHLFVIKTRPIFS